MKCMKFQKEFSVFSENTKSQLDFKPYSINKLPRIVTSEPIHGMMPRLDLAIYLSVSMSKSALSSMFVNTHKTR